MKDDPIDKCIMLIEDRISEILDHDGLKMVMGDDRLPTKKYVEDFSKYVFLKELSTNLAKFSSGVYPY